ncbi:hypothetical protein BH11PLA2_BH11PLA2_47590 [soil metagenome]
MWEIPPDHPLTRTFAGLTEHAFLSRFGIADPPLVDYLSGLLSRFVHIDAINCLPSATGRPLTDVATMICEAEGLPEGGKTRREYYRHIGDVTLFWTGLFPETLERDRTSWGRQAVLNYTAFGKRSYRIAGQFADAPECPVLLRLSEEFEVCAVGLREVRRDWEQFSSENNGMTLIT